MRSTLGMSRNLIGLVVFVTLPASSLHAKGPASATVEPLVAPAEQLSNSFRRARDIIQPSVVSITSEKKLRIVEKFRDRVPEIPDELRRFFGDGFGRFFDGPILPETPGFQRGYGSGVIVASGGYILTNSHVISGADDITVKLQDESTHKATVVGTDPKSEVAVIKIDADGLPAASLADSDKVRELDWVLAIGGPFGLNNTVTAGIVSAKGRDMVGIADRLSKLERFRAWAGAIESFWLEPDNQQSKSWQAHRDINSVMLATSLAPDGYLIPAELTR